MSEILQSIERFAKSKYGQEPMKFQYLKTKKSLILMNEGQSCNLFVASARIELTSNV